MKRRVRITLLIYVALIYCGRLAAQEQQSADTTGLFDKLSDFGEAVIDKLTFPTEKGVWAIYPAGGYSSRTGVDLGIMPIYSWDGDSLMKGSVNTLTSSIQVSTKGMVEIRSQLEWFLSSRWQLKTRLEWLRLNDSYWGRWSENSDSEMNYRSDKYGAELSLFRRIESDFYAGIKAGIRSYDLKNMENAPQQPAGGNGGMLSGIGPALLFDSRDHVLAPRSGSYFNASWTIFLNEFISDYTFNNYMVDFRHFIPIGRPVLAFHALWEFSDGDVPFFTLPQLGGKERLRGIGHNNRVVDNSVWFLKSELRSHIWWRIGGVVFAGTGQASHRPGFNPDMFIYSGGAGLRFRMLPDEPLNIRVDAAVSSDGQHGIFISLREAF